ncbi:MAG: hypothetical protein AB7V55_02230 [Oscillospiraceae bacterium]
MPVQPVRPVSAKASLKTSVDSVCGVIFLVLGLLLLGISVYSIRNTFYFFAHFFTNFTYYVDSIIWGPYRLLYINDLLSGIASVLWLVAAIILVAAGIISLVSGRGRAPAQASLPFMLLALLMNIIGFILLSIEYPGAMSFMGVLYWVFIIVKLAAIVAVLILLPIKKKAKAGRMAAMRPAAYPPPVAGAAYPPPAAGAAPAPPPAPQQMPPPPPPVG